MGLVLVAGPKVKYHVQGVEHFLVTFHDKYPNLTRKYLKIAARTWFFDWNQVFHSYTELDQPSRHSGRS